MRQAVGVHRQILLPWIRSEGETGIQHVAAVSSTTVSAVGELGALDGPDLSDVCFEGLAIIRAGVSTHPLLDATPDVGRKRWILILCAWTIVGLLFAVRRVVLVKVQGTHVNWAVVGAIELVYWYVWAAYTPLVIGLAKRFPLTGPRFVPHVAIHTIASLVMAPLASVTEYYLSHGLVRSVFRLTDPAVLRLLPPFAASVLSMSFTGMLTYWVIVGLYQSIHFYQAAMERQTIAAQLEMQLSHAELENLKSQLHPHFLFNSLHTIGILMREDVDDANKLLVCLGDLLRMALERRENEITLQSELEFVGKYLEIEQTRFHDRLKVHLDVPPDLLAVYVPSLALQPLVENAIKHGISVDSAAGRLEIAAKHHNGRVWLCVRDDGPGLAPGSRLRFGVGLTNVQSRLKQLYGDESSLELTGGNGRGCEAIITIPLRSSREDTSPHRR
jgi:two-component system, LytTR family, sensor kinase